MKHIDMRKLPAAAREERRRQVIGLRERGLSDEAIAAPVGLSRTGVFNICQRFARAGVAGLASQRRGPAPGHGRVLAAEQETSIRALIAWVKPTSQTLQPMGPAYRPRGGNSDRDRPKVLASIKVLASNQRRCSMKSGSWQTGTSLARPTTAS
jgi:hypothetical protein